MRWCRQGRCQRHSCCIGRRSYAARAPCRWTLAGCQHLDLALGGWACLFTCAGLVLGRCGEHDIVARGPEGVVQAADVQLRPAVIVGLQDADGLSARGCERGECERELHGGFGTATGTCVGIVRRRRSNNYVVRPGTRRDSHSDKATISRLYLTCADQRFSPIPHEAGMFLTCARRLR